MTFPVVLLLYEENRKKNKHLFNYEEENPVVEEVNL